MYSVPSPELSDVGTLSKIASRPKPLKYLETSDRQRSTAHPIGIEGISSLMCYSYYILASRACQLLSFIRGV